MKAQTYASISSETLQRAAEYQHQKALASKFSSPVPMPEELQDEESTRAADFLRTVEYCSGSAQHTAAHAKHSRVKNFGLSNAYGKATYWLDAPRTHLSVLWTATDCFCLLVVRDRVTISPDDINSVRLHTMVNGRRCDERTGERAVRSINLARHPGAAARTFLELYHAVVYYVLGWDAVAKRPLKAVCAGQPDGERGGLLGVVRAWAACVETQARGSLHMHILVWAAGHCNLTRRMNSAHEQQLFAPLPQCLPLAVGPIQSAPDSVRPLQTADDQLASARAPLHSAPAPSAHRTGDCLDHKHSNAGASATHTATVATHTNDQTPATAPVRELLMATQLRSTVDSVLSAELAVCHPMAVAYARRYARATGLTDSQLRLLEDGGVCVRVIDGAVCGGKLVAPRKRMEALRYLCASRR
jgi:hypothetical protein